MKDSYVSVNFKHFISMLDRCNHSPHLFPSVADETYFDDNLISFCNCSHDYHFTDNDFDIICKFLSLSIQKIVILVTDNSLTSSDVGNIRLLLDFSKYLALYWKNYQSRALFTKVMNHLISYPLKEDLSEESISYLFSFYAESSLLKEFCFCTDTVMQFKIPDELLSMFLRRASRSKYLNYFCFFLYKFNPGYFRRHNRIFPDECNFDDLYYGLISGYFRTMGYQDEAFEILDSTLKSFLLKNYDFSQKKLDNPLYSIWMLYKSSIIPSIKEYSNYFDLLFNN